MSESNTVIATFVNTKEITTAPIFQYDYGMVLKFDGVELPESYEVHFANYRYGASKVMIGDSTGVEIPYEYTKNYGRVFAWVFIHESEDVGWTKYLAEIPVIQRAKPSYDPVDPYEQSIVEQLVSTVEGLQDDVSGVQEDVTAVQEDVQTLQQTAAQIATNTQNINDLKIAVNDMFPTNELTYTFKTGYYYNNALDLTANATSTYLDGFDCLGYDFVILKTRNKLTSNSARHIGTKKDGAIRALYTIQSLVSRCVQVGDHWETIIPIDGSDTLFFSIQTATDPFMLELSPRISDRLIDSVTYETVYVDSTNGNDTNVGSLRTSPLRTIQQAIDNGAKNILVKEGSYQPFTMLEKTGVTISVDTYYSDYTAQTDEGYPSIVIDCNNSSQYGVELNRCVNCTINNVVVSNALKAGFRIYRTVNCSFNKCTAHDIGLTLAESEINGFEIKYSDATLFGCLAYNIATNTAGQGTGHYDGFNIHYTGNVNLIDCVAYNCEDDGVSHHDATTGIIQGGEFYNCGKAGVASPTYGAKVNINGVYSHNNDIGLYAQSSGVLTDRGNVIINSCVFSGNNTYDVEVGSYYSVIAINCVYSTVNGSENITRFPV